jgi:hypothetical protein
MGNLSAWERFQINALWRPLPDWAVVLSGGPVKYQSALKWLVLLIWLLALCAAGAGLFYQTSGEPYSFTSHRGEAVSLAGRGLYRYDTVSHT